MTKKVENNSYEHIDFLAGEEEHELSLPYFKCHRVVLETFVEKDVSATAQRVYLYLCHNSLIHQGISHKISIAKIAKYVKRSQATIYKAIAELEEAGLGTIRKSGKVVFTLPAITMAQVYAKTHAINEHLSEDEEAIKDQIESLESTLNRPLTQRERDRFISIQSRKKYE